MIMIKSPLMVWGLKFAIILHVQRWVHTNTPKYGGLDTRYRIYVEPHYIDKNNDSDNDTNNIIYHTRIIKTQLSESIPVAAALSIHKMPKNPENFPPNVNYETDLDALEFSRKITIVIDNLLLNYDSNIRPGHGGPPAIVTTNMEIRSMGPISEVHMEYSLDCYFRQKWIDTRLQFTGPSEFLSLSINMLDRIWKPDTYFHTGRESYVHTITRPNKFIRIYQNGIVYYSMRITIKSRCPMQLHNFPMDKQSCPLKFGSYVYPIDQLVYIWDNGEPVIRDKELSLPQFDLLTTPYRNGTVDFQRGNYSVLQVNFNLQRHIGYFLIQIYVPCALIVVLSWVSFWINREATADRVGLGITAVLTLSTFGLDTRTDLPRVSYPTALDWFTIMCFLFVVFSMLEFAGVHYFTKVGFGEVPVIEIDEDWAEDRRSEEESHENPLHIIAPPKAYQSNEEKIMNRAISALKSHLESQITYCPKHHYRYSNQYNQYTDYIAGSSLHNTLDRYYHAKLPSEYTDEVKGYTVEDDDDDEYEDYESEDDDCCNCTDGLCNTSIWSKMIRCIIQFWYCLIVNEDFKEEMRKRRIRGEGAANSVSLIDKTSRILFPLIFIILNGFYWVFYWLEMKSEFRAFDDEIK